MERLNVSRQPRGGLVVTPSATGIFQVWERPLVNHRYLVTVRPGGAVKVVRGSRDRERSVLMVLRQGYIDPADERWHPHRLVSRLVAPALLDPTPLAELVAIQAEWYGGALAFVEVKDGPTLAKECQRLDVSVQIREVLDKSTSEWTKELGWLTDDESGPAAINALVNAIRETGVAAAAAKMEDWKSVNGNRNALRVECEHCLAELGTFLDADSALPAVSHDDDVRALATGIYNIEAATKLHPHVRARQAPNDGWKAVESFGW